MATAKKTTYVAEGRQEEYDEADYTAYTDDQLDYDVEAGEPRCVNCGELLAWHEQACSAGRPEQPELEMIPAPGLRGFTQIYAFDLGHLVQPVPEAQAHTIIWRGQLRERHPRTGFVHRVNVYRLDDGYWDCYREEELQVA